MSPRRFFLSVLTSLAAVLLVVALFNGLVDHSRLFRAPEIAGFNVWKPYFFVGQFVSKPHTVRRLQPDGLILGTSRAGASLRTTHPAWSGYRSYNFALAGSSAELQWWNFRHALAAGEVRRAVLGLDFMMFNSCWNQGSEPQYQRYYQRLDHGPGRVNWRYPVRYIVDHLGELTSVTSTRLSWLTWRAQSLFSEPSNGHLHLEADGFWRRFPAPEENIYQGFRSSERHYLRNTWFPPPRDCYALADGGNARQLEFLKRLMVAAHAAEVELHLYFSPFHARFAEAMSAAGLWTEFENLKREVVRLNEQSATDSGRQPYPVWDFSGYNTVNTEPVPRRGDTRTRMEYYVDGTHSTPVTGDLIQDTLFGTTTGSIGPLDDFGVALTSANLEQVLEQHRRGQADYRADHREEFDEIQALAARLGRL